MVKYRSAGIPTTLKKTVAQLGNVLEHFNEDLGPYYGHMWTLVEKALHRESFN